MVSPSQWSAAAAIQTAMASVPAVHASRSAITHSQDRVIDMRRGSSDEGAHPESDVIDQVGACLLPSRPPGGELILDRPLLERLVHHRRGVVNAQRRIVVGNVGVGRCRHDAVDHGRRKAGMRVDPKRERSLARFGERHHQSANQRAVMRQVVTAQNRKRAAVRASTCVEGRDHQTDRAPRRFRMRQVVHNFGMR
jgi:hypothetical protein